MSSGRKAVTIPMQQTIRLLVCRTRALTTGTLFVICLSWMYAYRTSSDMVTFTVDHRERITQMSGDSVESYYLVWSREGEVFKVTDDWLFLTWNSSDRYGQLKEGSTVTAKVAGWRVPILSWYRNVVRIQSVGQSRVGE